MAELLPIMRTYLIGKSGITTAFGSTLTRLYVDRIDEKLTTTYPFAIIRDVAGGPSYAHDGDMPDTSFVQVDVYSDAQGTADSGRAAIEAELSGYKGSMGAIAVGSAFITNKRGSYDPDSRTFRRSLDVEIGQNG